MDTGGLLGPAYSYADELSAPSELGIGRDGSIGGIMRAVGGINYYVDAIGFGESTMLARNMGLNQNPLGIRYFIKTGQTCDNGADMYEYINTVPNGLPGRVGNEIQNALGVKLRGMAPGIMEDAAGALNPMPLFKSVMGSGYKKCKKVTLPVGDLNGNVRSRYDPNNVWIKENYKVINGLPHQTRWVFDSYESMEEYDAVPKSEKSGVLPETEGFVNMNISKSNISAGVLLAALTVGVLVVLSKK